MSDFIYFNTINKTKISEIKEIFSSYLNRVKFLSEDIREILDSDINSVIMAKAASAYQVCRVPVIVEHGALVINYFNGFPGAVSKPMWDSMQGKICKLIPIGEPRDAVALSGVCYCDGFRRKVFVGKTEGTISTQGRGGNGFQWDPIFIPNGSTRTYAEMDQTEKLKYSQAAKAYNELIKHLNL